VRWLADGVEDEDGDRDGAQLLGLGLKMGMADSVNALGAPPVGADEMLALERQTSG
jgi:hypothetical protein